MTTSYPPPPASSSSFEPMSVHSASSSTRLNKPHRFRFALAFFVLGLINNVLYVVILSAALDLVNAASTPKGVILFVNIVPALLVKIGWPYFVRGEIRYARRVVACSAVSFIGILIVATSSSLLPRLFGISVASFSSGLGEMTYLQLSIVYGSLNLPGVDLGGIAVGWFSSGTGAAGLVGAGLWWVLRGLGVKQALLICSFLPLCMSLSYFVLLPPPDKFANTPFDAYASIPELDSEGEESDDDEYRPQRDVEATRGLVGGSLKPAHLSTAEKLALARPLVVRYMLPLFLVYLAEYTINSGVAPTLIYEVPDPAISPVLSLIIKSLRDYYPLWQLVYQTFVFISRSSLSILHLPPLPIALLPLPTLFQLGLLLIASLESATGFISNTLGESSATWVVFFLVSCEGLAGGTAYVNAFYHLGQDEEEVVGGEHDKARRLQEREFRIASVGFADTCGIMLASVVSMGLEPQLCSMQVARGRTLCKQL